MISLASINLKVDSPITIYTSNGAAAGKLDAGNYVAEVNAGQQQGWYSFYSADSNFNKTGNEIKLANVHLSIDQNGQISITA